MLLFWLEGILMAEMGGEEYDGLNKCLKELFGQCWILFSMLTFIQCRILGYSELEGDYSFDFQQDDQ